MGYYINPNELGSMFVVPSSVVEKHIKLASAVQLKVLLWCLKNTDKGYNSSLAANELRLDETAVLEALSFWCDCGVLCNTEETAKTKPTPPAAEKPKKVIRNYAIKPDRIEAAKRGLECEEIAFILRESEQKFGRVLRQNEISTLVWLYDDQGISASLLLMIVGYAVSEGRPNIGFIERTAIEWVNDGVDDIISAEKRLVEMRRRQSAWHVVETAMGIDRRQPSKSELEIADKWVNEWNYGRGILKAAYDACVDATSKFSIPYIKKIIAEWHKQGVKTLNDINALSIKGKPDQKKHSGDKYMDFVNNLVLRNEED